MYFPDTFPKHLSHRQTVVLQRMCWVKNGISPKLALRLLMLSILSWPSLSMKGNLCSSPSLLKADEGCITHPPTTHQRGGCPAALYKTNGFLWPKWGQGTHCSRYLLMVKTLRWSLKVQVEILSQSELENISSVFRNWKNQTIGKGRLLLSLDSAAVVQRMLWQRFILPSGQDTFFLLC